MEEVDIEAIWSLAYEARLQTNDDENSCNDTGEAIRCGDAECERERTCIDSAAAHASVVQLADGDWHVCLGRLCPHTVLNLDRHLVCELSGTIVGSEKVLETTPGWTGRSVSSANPDDNACIASGAWKRRRDLFSASAAAWSSAREMSCDDVVQANVSHESSDRCQRRRGAPCVGEDDSNERSRRRTKPVCRSVDTREATEKLAEEAMIVIERLFSTTSARTSSREAVPTPCAPAQPLDPRLQNPQFVLALALRQYVANAVENGGPLDMLTLHDTCVHAHDFVRARKADQQRAGARDAPVASVSKPVGFSGRVRRLLANMVVSLWRALSHTPHMQCEKRTHDSFRPFVSGVVYALKRGVYIRDVCVVPKLTVLADMLPKLRTPNASLHARHAHSLSHRGLSSMHRAVASIDTLPESKIEEVRCALSVAAQAAECLRAHVEMSSEGSTFCSNLKLKKNRLP